MTGLRSRALRRGRGRRTETGVDGVWAAELARTGLSAQEATTVGFSSPVDSSTKAGYFPGPQPIRLKMLAICIRNEMSVDELLSIGQL
jgi:hypothetical protein